MSELVEKLSKGDHMLDVGLRSKQSPSILKEAIDRGYVHVKFIDTLGGTELGVRLDKDECNLDADFVNGTGRITLKGKLTLDYVKVQCVADIELPSLKGKGHLVVL